MERYVHAWINYEANLRELIDAGNEVVVVLHETARAKGTEMSIERNLAFVCTLREGRAIRMRGYRTKQEGLEPAGLRDELEEGRTGGGP